jgi:hypothetical protein
MDESRESSPQLSRPIPFELSMLESQIFQDSGQGYLVADLPGVGQVRKFDGQLKSGLVKDNQYVTNLLPDGAPNSETVSVVQAIGTPQIEIGVLRQHQILDHKVVLHETGDSAVISGQHYIDAKLNPGDSAYVLIQLAHPKENKKQTTLRPIVGRSR